MLRWRCAFQKFSLAVQLAILCLDVPHQIAVLNRVFSPPLEQLWIYADAKRYFRKRLERIGRWLGR